MRKLQLVYGYWYGILFLTKAPSPVAYSNRKYLRGCFNLKAKKDFDKRNYRIFC